MNDQNLKAMNDQNLNATTKGAPFSYNNLFFSKNATFSQAPPPASKMCSNNSAVPMPLSSQQLSSHQTAAAPFYNPSVVSSSPSNTVTATTSRCERTGVQSQMEQKEPIDVSMIQKTLHNPKLVPAEMPFMDATRTPSSDSWAHQAPISASASADLNSSVDLNTFADLADLNGVGGRSYTRSFASAMSKSTKRRRSSANLFAEGLEDLQDEDITSALQALCDDDENDVPTIESIQTPLSPGVSSAMGALSVISPALSGNSQTWHESATEGSFSLPPPAEAAKDPCTPQAAPSASKRHRKKKTKVVTGRTLSSKSKKSHSSPMASPQQYLNQLLTERGYSTSTCSSFDVGYHTKPSPLQLASFGTKLVGAIHKPNIALLSSLLSSGLSRNPCNDFGDSIINLICKRGNKYLFQCLVQNGCDVRVADEWGRTPLHYAAWASRPCFDSVEMMLDQDVNLLRVLDKNGVSPLEYVTTDKWAMWLDFLEGKKYAYWPIVEQNQDWKERVPVIHRPNGTLPDPDDMLSVDLAELVASGEVTPEDVQKMAPEARKSYKKVQKQWRPRWMDARAR